MRGGGGLGKDSGWRSGVRADCAGIGDLTLF